nr:immunoglobulin heavy chain junction region [Macaca mulatta]MOX04820.1 immunoglobulin heavy chain junction region [Macaca mulatta]
CARQQVLFDYW